MIKIRKAAAQDCQDLFNWRNDPKTIQMSHNNDSVTWDEHKIWFSDKVKSINTLILICEDYLDFSKIGVVRFDLHENFSLISINLSPDMRGKGKSSLCINAAIKNFKELFPEIKSIYAEVKKQNLISSKLFKKCGFKLEKDKNDVYLYLYKIE
jgi:RimJ/RimL family protein N-acetyltransferase